MAGFGFSAGDILAAAELVYMVKQAVKESSGSLSGYEGLVAALNSTEESLRQLSSLEVDDDHKQALQSILDAYEKSFVEFNKKTKTYDTSLGRTNRPSKWWQELPKKINWQKYTRTEILRFQNEMQMHAQAMHALVLVSFQRETQKSHANFDNFKFDILSSLATQTQNYFVEVGLLICIWTCVHHVLDYMLQLSTALAQYQGLHLSQIPKTVTVATARLQDANGLSHSLDLNIVRSWKCLRVIIRDIFKGQSGWLRVRMGRYLLYDAFSMKELKMDAPFAEHFRHGREINMNALFGRNEVSTAVCPRCSVERSVQTEAAFTCKCGFYCGVAPRLHATLLDAKSGRRGAKAAQDVDNPTKWRSMLSESSEDSSEAREELPQLRRKKRKQLPKGPFPDEPGDFARISILLNADDLSPEAVESKRQQTEEQMKILLNAWEAENWRLSEQLEQRGRREKEAKVRVELTEETTKSTQDPPDTTSTFADGAFDPSSTPLRLLRLLGTRDDRIKCKFETVPRGPQYTALSYAWGTYDPTKFITVNYQNFTLRSSRIGSQRT